MASIIAVENETRGTSNRMTKSGRKITYEMTVVQQPERARACGQGAKSSTDRRPVDPPPIVDLRVFEGEDGSKRDISCAWNANFFLFASLEQARPIAQGRVPPTANNAPILTGTPVAGMSYLERPQPAGYFIFPDLSVRHEGKYRLSFQLFEEIQNPDDRDAVEPTSAVGGGIGETYHGRCQVKSVPFTVYSAKKFPGLAESTHLSRMVADQGCRVRIRRDVRMRRRDNKDSKDWDEYEEKPTADHVRRTPSPEPQSQAAITSPEVPHHDAMDTSRSSTHASYNTAEDHRKSSQDISPQYPQYQQAYAPKHLPPPPPPPAPPAPQVPQHSYPPQYDATAMNQYHQHQQYLQQQQMVQSPQTIHPQQQQYGYGYAAQTMMQYPHGYYPPYQQPQAQPQPPQQQPQMFEQRYDSIIYGPPPPPPPQYANANGGIPAPPLQYAQQGQMQVPAPLGQMGHGYGQMMQPTSPSYSAPPNQTPVQPTHGKDLPPLKALETYPGKYEATSPTVGMPNERANSYNGYQSVNVPPPPQYVNSGPTNAKRSFGSVFNTQHIDQRMQAGIRPLTANGSQDMIMATPNDEASDDDAMDMESVKMQYRRADGTQVSRRWPTARP